MKKNVIAAAVAAALIAPVAMAEVTISGGLQAELMNMSGDGAVEGLYATDGGEYNAENSGNYGFLKFSASEDLGDGMKAIAMYNLNANVGDTGSAGLGARDAYVGLSAGFGTVMAGTMNTPYKSSTVGWDPMLATSLQARGSNGMSDAHNGYASNAIAYANTFGSVKLVAAVVLDESTDPDDDTQTNGKHAMSFSINAPVGPVELAVAHVNASEYGDIRELGMGATAKAVVEALVDAGLYTLPAGKTSKDIAVSLEDLSATKVGAKWVSGDITVAGQYEMIDLGDVDPTYFYLTASYAMGNNTLSAAYGINDLDVDGVDDSTYMMVGLNHKFSKSTNAFVGYRASNHDSDADADVSVISAGMRVNF